MRDGVGFEKENAVANDTKSATTWWRVADSPAPGRAGSRLWRATGTPFTPAPFESARESLPNKKHRPMGGAFCLVESGGLEPSTFRV